MTVWFLEQNMRWFARALRMISRRLIFLQNKDVKDFWWVLQIKKIRPQFSWALLNLLNVFCSQMVMPRSESSSFKDVKCW